MGNSKLSVSLGTNDIDISQNQDNSTQLSKLVLPKVEKRIFPTSYTNATPVSSNDTLRKVRANIRPGSKLTSCELLEKPRGIGKQWSLKMDFSDLSSYDHDGTVFFSCHQLRGFTNYSIHIDGQEFWFDDYDNAFASLLGKEDAPFHLIDMINKTKY